MMLRVLRVLGEVLAEEYSTRGSTRSTPHFLRNLHCDAPSTPSMKTPPRGGVVCRRGETLANFGKIRNFHTFNYPKFWEFWARAHGAAASNCCGAGAPRVRPTTVAHRRANFRNSDTFTYPKFCEFCKLSKFQHFQISKILGAGARCGGQQLLWGGRAAK